MSKWQWKDYRRQDSWSVKQSWKSRDYSDYNKQWRRSHSWSDSSWQDGDSEVQDSVHRPVRSADDLGQEYVIHGTFLPAWLKIRTEGLKTMDGEYIHMCLGLPGKGAMSEIRKDCDVAVFIDIIRAIQAGIKFWQSSNGVILTNGEGNSQTVRPEFFLRVLWLGPGGQQLVIFDKYGDQTDTNRKDDKDFNAALQKAEWAEHGATQNGATRKGRPDTGGMRPSEPEAPPKQCRPNPPTPPQPPSASRDHDARWWTEASMVSEDVHYRSSMRDEQASGGSGYGNRKGWQKDWSWEDKHLSHRPNSQPSTEGSTSAPLASLALGQDPKRVNAEERDRSVEQGQALQWKAQDELNQAWPHRNSNSYVEAMPALGDVPDHAEHGKAPTPSRQPRRPKPHSAERLEAPPSPGTRPRNPQLHSAEGAEAHPQSGGHPSGHGNVYVQASQPDSLAAAPWRKDSSVKQAPQPSVQLRKVPQKQHLHGAEREEARPNEGGGHLSATEQLRQALQPRKVPLPRNKQHLHGAEREEVHPQEGGGCPTGRSNMHVEHCEALQPISQPDQSPADIKKDFNAALQKAEWAEHAVRVATPKCRPDKGDMRASPPQAQPKYKSLLIAQSRSLVSSPTPLEPCSALRNIKRPREPEAMACAQSKASPPTPPEPCSTLPNISDAPVVQARKLQPHNAEREEALQEGGGSPSSNDNTEHLCEGSAAPWSSGSSANQVPLPRNKQHLHGAEREEVHPQEGSGCPTGRSNMHVEHCEDLLDGLDKHSGPAKSTLTTATPVAAAPELFAPEHVPIASNAAEKVAPCHSMLNTALHG